MLLSKWKQVSLKYGQKVLEAGLFGSWVPDLVAAISLGRPFAADLRDVHEVVPGRGGAVSCWNLPKGVPLEKPVEESVYTPSQKQIGLQSEIKKEPGILDPHISDQPLRSNCKCGSFCPRLVEPQLRMSLSRGNTNRGSPCCSFGAVCGA